MARIYQTGFETYPYYPPGFSRISSVHGSGVMATTAARSGSYGFGMSAGWSDTNTYRITLPDPTASEWFVRIAYKPGSYSSNSDTHSFWIRDSADAEIVRLRFPNASTAQLVVLGTQRSSYSFSVPLSGWHLFEIHAKLGNVDGLVEVRWNTQNIMSFSGDTMATAALLQHLDLYIRDSGTDPSYSVDDIAINDPAGVLNNTWCGDGYILALRPSAPGDLTQWVDQAGSQDANYMAVDEAAADGDTTYVRASEVNLTDLYQLADPTVPDGYGINAVQAFAIARIETPESDTLSVGCKLGADAVWGNPATLLSTTYLTVDSVLMELAPDGMPWTQEKVNSLQVGIRSGLNET